MLITVDCFNHGLLSDLYYYSQIDDHHHISAICANTSREITLSIFSALYHSIVKRLKPMNFEMHTKSPEKEAYWEMKRAISSTYPDLDFNTLCFSYYLICDNKIYTVSKGQKTKVLVYAIKTDKMHDMSSIDDGIAYGNRSNPNLVFITNTTGAELLALNHYDSITSEIVESYSKQTQQPVVIGIVSRV